MNWQLLGLTTVIFTALQADYRIKSKMAGLLCCHTFAIKDFCTDYSLNVLFYDDILKLYFNISIYILSLMLFS